MPKAIATTIKFNSNPLSWHFTYISLGALNSPELWMWARGGADAASKQRHQEDLHFNFNYTMKCAHTPTDIHFNTHTYTLVYGLANVWGCACICGGCTRSLFWLRDKRTFIKCFMPRLSRSHNNKSNNIYLYAAVNSKWIDNTFVVCMCRCVRAPLATRGKVATTFNGPVLPFGFLCEPFKEIKGLPTQCGWEDGRAFKQGKFSSRLLVYWMALIPLSQICSH